MNQSPASYLLDDFHQILQHLPTLADVLVSDDGCGQVAQYVWAHGLNSIEVPVNRKTYNNNGHMLEGHLQPLHENMKSHDAICRGQTLFSQRFPASSHIVNLQILNKQRNKSQSMLKAPLSIGPTVEGREKEKPLSRHGSPATVLQSSETLSTRDLFFSHRSTSCGLLQE